MSTFYGHDGKRMPELAQPVISHRSHPMGAERANGGMHAKAAILRPSRGRDVRAVPVAGGMSHLQHSGMAQGGLGHAVQSGAVAIGPGQNPLSAKLAPAKTPYAPARPVVGHRDRSHDAVGGSAPGQNASHPACAGDHDRAHDIGRRVLAEATKSGADLPQAPMYGRDK
jgi:hypothetical protein